jgi:uncharacterized paraquat-inducible protein A
MKEEQFKWNQELIEARLKEQKDNQDYNDEREKCECGTYLNSRDHCPRCDY